LDDGSFDNHVILNFGEYGDQLDVYHGNPTQNANSIGWFTPTNPGWFFWALVESGLFLTPYAAKIGDKDLTASSANLPSGDDPAPTDFYLGDSGAPASSEPLNGRIFNVKVFDQVMNATQIAQERWSQVPRFFGSATPNLWAWWPLFSADDLKDYSGNGRDLSKAGSPTTEEHAPVTWAPVVLTPPPTVYELNAEAGSYAVTGADARLKDYVSALDCPGSQGNYASTLDASALDITGDIDVRAYLALADYTPSDDNAIISKMLFSGNNKSWFLRVKPDGELRFWWSEDGELGKQQDSTEALSLAAWDRIWLRATLDVDNDAGGHEVNFYTSEDGSSWDLLGSSITDSGTTSIKSGSAPVEVGRHETVGATWKVMEGEVYRAQIYDGIDGTLVFDSKFNIQKPGTTSFTESSPQEATVTINQSGSPQAEIIALLEPEIGSYAVSGADATLENVPATAHRSYLSCPGSNDNHADNPDAAELDITGDMEIWFYALPDDVTPSSVECFISKILYGNDKHWRFVLFTDGLLRWIWSENGVNFLNEFSTEAPGWSDGNPRWIRMRFDVDNGASGYDVDFYESEDDFTVDDPTWTALGSKQTGTPATSIDAGAAEVKIGNTEAISSTQQPFAGKIWRAKIYSGIDSARALIRDYEFWREEPGTTSFTESSSYGTTVTVDQSGSPHAEIWGVAELDPGSYGITGAPTTLEVSEVTAYEMNAAAGAYSLTGVAATLLADRVINAAPTSYALTGADATFLVGVVMDAEPGAYSLTGVLATLLADHVINAEPDSYGVTGSLATLLADRQLNAEPDSYDVTGAAATSLAARVLNAEPDSYALAGIAATLIKGVTLDAEPGAYSLTGVLATLLADHALNAEPGAYSLTGVLATLLADRALNAEPGSYGLTGADAELEFGYILNAEPGTYGLTGVLATLLADRILNAEPDSYALSGQPTTLVAARVLNAEPDSYALTGANATLLADRVANAAAGAYTLTGSDATLLRALVVNAVAGAYNVTGYAAELLLIGAYSLNAEPGVYTLVGQATSLLLARLFNAEPGIYTSTGADASLKFGYALNAEPAAYTLSGVAANLAKGLVVNAEPGAYVLTGADVSFLRARIIDAVAGAYSITGADAELLLVGAYSLNAEPGIYTYSGQDAALPRGFVLNAETGLYTYTGQPATTLADRVIAALAAAYGITGADTTLDYSGIILFNAEAGTYSLVGADATLEAAIRAEEAFEFELAVLRSLNVDASIIQAKEVQLAVLRSVQQSLGVRLRVDEEFTYER
jgi:hypothetical protein